MRKFLARVLVLAGALSLLLPGLALAAAKSAAPLIVVAHTTKLKGIELWWGNLYNENMLVFTVLTGVFVPIAGAVLGLVGDLLMGLTGVDLEHRELAEH